MSDFVPWPSTVVARSLTGTACDMLIGPCACGATHTAQEAALALLERNESDVRTVNLGPLADQWADIIAASLPAFAELPDCEVARKTIREHVLLILKDPGKHNGFSTRDACAVRE